MARYRLAPVGVVDQNSATLILPGNSAEWLEYQAWLALGNVPDPLPTPPAPSAAELAARAELDARDTMRVNLRADATIAFLRTHTPAEVEAWVNANVTDLASAKNVLSKMAMVVAYLARERLAL